MWSTTSLTRRAISPGSTITPIRTGSTGSARQACGEKALHPAAAAQVDHPPADGGEFLQGLQAEPGGGMAAGAEGTARIDADHLPLLKLRRHRQPGGQDGRGDGQ